MEFVLFPPAAQSWNPVLARRLESAVEHAKSPIFIVQAENDYSLEPSRVLGKYLDRKGPPNRAKIYPSFGSTTQEGHGAFGSRSAGIAIWGPDVFAFLDSALQNRDH